MTVGVGPGSQGGMAGSRLGVGVVVVAIFKVGAMVEKKAEAPAFEIRTVAVKVVRTQLVDNQDDDKFGMPIVGAAPGHGRNNQESDEQLADTTRGDGHGDLTSIAKQAGDVEHA